MNHHHFPQGNHAPAGASAAGAHAGRVVQPFASAGGGGRGAGRSAHWALGLLGFSGFMGTGILRHQQVFPKPTGVGTPGRVCAVIQSTVLRGVSGGGAGHRHGRARV